MLIAIDGCLGAGKTTVARGLADYRRSVTLLEDFESNPFLRAFYQDADENATETEFAFLLLHYHQLRRNCVVVRESEVIADFHFAKDLIYAGLNLSDVQLKDEFQRLYGVFAERVPQPALLVFLSAPDDLIMTRIRH